MCELLVVFPLWAKEVCINLAEDLDIRLVLKSRNLVQLCLVIVCPTEYGNFFQEKFET